jgi:hypothetical protein
VDQEKKIEKLCAEFAILDDTQKDCLLGIAKALSFANAPGKAAGALPLSGPDAQGTEGGE